MITLTDDQRGALEGFIEIGIDKKIDEKQLVTKHDFKYLPTKSEFYNKVDEIMGELKAIREKYII